MLAQKAVENVGESAGLQKVDDALNQGVEAPPEDISVEENNELQAQNVDDDAREVAEILVSNTFGSKNQQMDVDEEIQMEHDNVGIQADFDLNVEDIPTDLYGEIFQDAQEESENIQQENIQQDNQIVQEMAAQNVQGQNVLKTVAQNVPIEPSE